MLDRSEVTSQNRLSILFILSIKYCCHRDIKVMISIPRVFGTLGVAGVTVERSRTTVGLSHSPGSFSLVGGVGAQ